MAFSGQPSFGVQPCTTLLRKVLISVSPSFPAIKGGLEVVQFSPLRIAIAYLQTSKSSSTKADKLPSREFPG